MAIKTFTTGEVLTAADTNTYLTNSGFQYVSSGSFTNAASFDVTGFSSTFDFYQLTFAAKKHTAGVCDITAVIVSGTTPRTTQYYGATRFAAFDATVGFAANRSNGANFYATSTTATNVSVANAMIHGIDDLEFVINLQSYDTANSRALYGSYSNYAATSSFTLIRFTGTANITGYWNLTGVRKA